MINEELNVTKNEEEEFIYDIVSEALELFEDTTSPSVEKESFKIDTDSKAEWALTVVRNEQKESDRYIETCKKMIEQYEEKIEKEKKRLERRTAYIRTLLIQYFNGVQHKKTKTAETYKLPSGTLKLKLPTPEFVREEEKLVEYAKNNNRQDLLKVKESIDWATLKKEVTVSGENVVDADGQIINGVRAINKNPEFIISFNEE